MWHTEHFSFTIVVFTYVAICMFSYFNLTYVRDFDVLQVNFTPILLTVCGIVALQRQYDFFLMGMVLSLIADSYFALRYKDHSDEIKFNVVERFAMESWSQEAFNKAGQVTLQIVSLCFIGLQIFLTSVGAHDKDKLCFVLLAFYLVRLAQFILTTNLAINIAQSNFVCVCLAVMTICTNFSLEMNLFTMLTCAVLTADAILGTAIFITHNKEEILKELGLYTTYKQRISGLNCQGHITNLNMQIAKN